MKSTLTGLLLLCSVLAFGQFSPVSPEAFLQAPIRVLGTNVVDFGPMITATIKNGRDSRFLVEGQIAEIQDDTAFIQRQVDGGFELDSSALTGAGPSELLTMMSVKQMLDHSNGKISAGEYFALSPNARQYLVPVRRIEVVALKNCPKVYQTIGRSVSLFAWPCGNRAIVHNGQEQSLRCYDYGEKFTGDGKALSFFLQISASGTVTTVPVKSAAVSPPPTPVGK